MSGEMVYGIATREWEEWGECVGTWYDHAKGFYRASIVRHMPIPAAQQRIFERTTEPIIAYIHDDCRILEKNWDVRVLRQFQDPKVGIVGFGGATRHGAPDLYTSPYHLWNLGRSNFLSNMRNAEAHGTRFSGECDVAVFDGFAIFIRRELLEKCGGFPMESGYFMYCEAMCCEARRHGYKLRLVGVDCDHLGGKTASMVNVKDSHSEAHLWLYDRYKDVLPFEVSQ